MEQIAKLLFAATLLSVFSYLLFFSSMTHSGNGGEYWGYNGIVKPSESAKLSFENRDYRFLVVNLSSDTRTRQILGQEYRVCENHPFGAENSLRLSSVEPLHNTQSFNLARNFAAQYNEDMMNLLAKQMGYRSDGANE